jgi:predicted DNA-binding transcriptional regulator YafY
MKKKWILDYGADAELLQPGDLREEIRKEVEQLSRRYCFDDRCAN